MATSLHLLRPDPTRGSSCGHPRPSTSARVLATTSPAWLRRCSNKSGESSTQHPPHSPPSLPHIVFSPSSQIHHAMEGMDAMDGITHRETEMRGGGRARQTVILSGIVVLGVTAFAYLSYRVGFKPYLDRAQEAMDSHRTSDDAAATSASDDAAATSRGEGAPKDLLRIALQADPIQRDGRILLVNVLMESKGGKKSSSSSSLMLAVKKSKAEKDPNRGGNVLILTGSCS